VRKSVSNSARGVMDLGVPKKETPLSEDDNIKGGEIVLKGERLPRNEKSDELIGRD